MATYRDLPSVDRLLRAVKAATGPDLPHDLVREAVRAELAATRDHLREQTNGNNGLVVSLEQLSATVQQRLARLTTATLRPLINASGVIIQTNLGRAPLSAAALAAMHDVGGGYANLEYDLVAGQRGSRNVHLEGLLCALTGAEAALAVNNNAAAIYLVLIALAAGREVIVSRGQAVEIGGGFRIPDVLRQSGATLVEVGTTNRTYPRDYAEAINANTALLMQVHTSNFRLQGFVHETSLADLAQVGRDHNVLVLDDLGSGTLLPTAPYGLAPEPTVQERVAAGADIVTFSGDKLLGGPQAGLIVGSSAVIDQLKRHPLARALRVDKTTIAGMEATLQSYLRGRAHSEIPVWQMITASLTDLRERATQIAAALIAAGQEATVIDCESAVGGGSLPGETLPSVAVAVRAAAGPDIIAARLRTGTPAVVPRISDDQIVFDVRTVLPAQDTALVAQVLAAVAAA